MSTVSTAQPLLLKNARLYLHEGDTDLPAEADLRIEGDRIAAIGPDLPVAGAEVLDLSGHLVMPGFVNGHYHSHDVLAKGMFETGSLEKWGIVAGAIGSNRSPEEVYLRTLLGAVECLRNGITTVQDFFNLAPFSAETLDAVLAAYRDAGIRVILSITVRDRSQLDTILWAEEEVPAELHPIIGTGAGDGAAQIEFIAREIARRGTAGGQVVWAISPSAPQRCSPGLLRRVAEFAEEADLPIYTHVYETRLQRIFAQQKFPGYGGSIVSYMEAAGLLGPRTTIAHGVWPDAEEIARLADTGTGVVLNMLSNLKLRSGVAPLAAYRRAGLPLSLGCDNCSCSDVQSMLQVMKLYCLLGGLSDPGPDRPLAREAIALATRGGAERAGLGGRTGAIAPGMAADLLAYSLADTTWLPLHSVARQLVFGETGRNLRHVWVAGRRVLAEGRCATVDEDKLKTDVEAMMPGVRVDLDRLWREAGQVDDAFQRIQKRAFEWPLSYDRYLQNS